MQGSDDTLRVFRDDSGLDKNGEPVAFVQLSSFQTIHREASRKTSDSSEDGFERFVQMMTDVISAEEECNQWSRQSPGNIGKVIYSKTWIAVTQDLRLLAMRVSPQIPMIMLSFCIARTRYPIESGATTVSASTCSTD